jgi:hypothetical protein
MFKLELCTFEIPLQNLQITEDFSGAFNFRQYVNINLYI